MTTQEARTRELLIRALPHVGPGEREDIAAYLVGDRSFSISSARMEPLGLAGRYVRTILHWACIRPGCDWEESARDMLEKHLDTHGYD
jgi:hypothetical protein